MTPEERKVLEDAEAQVFDSMEQLEEAQGTKGIRPPPTIDEDETTLDTQLFGFDFPEQPEAEAPESTSEGGEPCGPCPPPWDCPGGCTPPAGDCIHYIQFQVKLTQCDIDNDFSLLFQFNLNPDPAAFDVFTDSTGWTLAINGATPPNIFISIADVPIVACDCYDVLVAFSDPGGTDPINVTFCVNGVTATGTLDRGSSCATITGLFVGDPFGGDNVLNRKYRHFVANPGFDMDTDSFDSLVDASVITEGGVNVLLVNSAANPGYGLTNISWVIACSGC